MDTSHCLMVCKLDYETIVSEFSSSWVPHTSGLYATAKLSLVNNSKNISTEEMNFKKDYHM